MWKETVVDHFSFHGKLQNLRDSRSAGAYIQTVISIVRRQIANQSSGADRDNIRNATFLPRE
jgi:hypothetical protein